MVVKRRALSMALALCMLFGALGFFDGIVLAENPNLIKDPGMEGSSFQYTQWKCDLSLDKQVFHTGKQSLKVVKQDNYACVKFPVDIKKGQKFYYSAWAMLGPNSTKGQILRACIEYMHDGNRVQKVIGSTGALFENDWTQVKGTYTIEEPGNVSDVCLYFFTDLPPVPETYYLDDVEIKFSDGSEEETAPAYVPSTPTPPPVKPDLKPYSERLAEMMAQDGDNISVFIDGELQKFDQPPVIINDRTMVPVRGIFEKLGAQIDWVAEEQKVLAKKGSVSVELKIGSNTAKVNGSETTLDQPPQIVNSRTLVPIRFISEALGAEVYWNALTKAVSVYSGPVKDLMDSLGRLSDKSIVSNGDISRLAKLMRKAEKGEPIMLGYIGGSITAGASASTEERRYANLITKWFREKFPNTKVEMVNAGLGATGSSVAVHRLYETLLKYEPDFVTIEFAVNDGANASVIPFYEQLARSILNSPKKPAVMLLFFTNNQGNNAQEFHSLVGKNYNLPMVSYRDAVWPDISNNVITWADLYGNDIVHPNDSGHYLISKFATDRLEEAYILRNKYTDDINYELPAPLIYPENYMDGKVLTPKEITPVSKDGWEISPPASFSPDWQKFFGPGWLIKKAGATLVFEGIEGNNIGIVYKSSPKNVNGAVSIKIDGKVAGSVNAFSTVSYEYPVPAIMATKLPDGKHKVEITLNEKPDVEVEFTLLAIITSRSGEDIFAGKPLKEGKTWTFEEDGNMQGWTVNWDVADEKVSGGALTARATGRDPQMISPPGLTIDTTKCKKIKVLLKNGTTGAQGQIFFITDTDPKWDEPKSVRFSVVTEDKEYTEYIVDFSEIIGWRGTVTQIRLDPANAEGEFSVKKISVLEVDMD